MTANVNVNKSCVCSDFESYFGSCFLVYALGKHRWFFYFAVILIAVGWRASISNTAEIERASIRTDFW